MKKLLYLILLLLLVTSTYARSINKTSYNKVVNCKTICRPIHKIKYKGYVIIRSINKGANYNNCLVQIKKNGKVVKSIKADELIDENDSMQVGLYSLLNKETKQLILVDYSGGAHCCFSYWIYDLYPSFQLIFNSNKYNIGDGFDELQFRDINNDGIFEFTQQDMSFVDFGESYVSSPMPKIVFEYDSNSHKYYPANPKYRRYLQQNIKGIMKYIRQINKHGLNRANNDKYKRDGLDLFLYLIYSGKKTQAWEFYNREYKWGSSKQKMTIIKLLNKDLIYKQIYYSH